MFCESLLLLLVSLLGAKLCFLVAGALSTAFEMAPFNSFRFGPVMEAMNENIGPGARKLQRDRTADALRRAGDGGDLSGEWSRDCRRFGSHEVPISLGIHHRIEWDRDQ